MNFADTKGKAQPRLSAAQEGANKMGHLTGVLGDDAVKNQHHADDFNAKILNDCFGVQNWQP
jgi:hypothetical protein